MKSSPKSVLLVFFARMMSWWGINHKKVSDLKKEGQMFVLKNWSAMKEANLVILFLILLRYGSFCEPY